MNRKRLISLLLVLFMLAALLPVSAYAEETVFLFDTDTEENELVLLRFTGVPEAALRHVTVYTAGGIPLTPVIDESGLPVHGSYQLAPGTYFYAFHDPDGNYEDIPETGITLDGSAPEVEAALFYAAPVNETEPELEAQTIREEEDGAAAMPVILRCDGIRDLSGLTVVRDDGTVMQPYVDPDTSEVQYGNYLLIPGIYSYRIHDPEGRAEDAEGSFIVDESGVQTVDIHAAGTVEGMCFSGTFINPSYSDVIDAASIPTPSISPEESLNLLMHEVEGLPYAADDEMNAVYYAGPDGTREPRYSPVVYDTLEAAGAAVKRGLLRRQKDIAIRIRCDIYPTDEAWTNTSKMIYATAIRHTGAPTDGDYLRYEYGGVNCTGSAVGVGTKGPYYYEFNYAPLYFTNYAQEMVLDERINSILNSLHTAGMSDEQKISAVYQYLCDNVKYREGGDTINFTAYGALVNGLASCQGISVAFYRMCLELGVDARVVTSMEMGHAWNIARADGRHYYALDATWDVGSTPETRKFFLKGRTRWLTEHTLGDEFINSSFADYDFPAEDYGSEATGVIIDSVALLFDGMLQIKYYFIIPEALLKEPGACAQFSREGEVFGSVLLSEAKLESGKVCFYCSVEVRNIDNPIRLRIMDGNGNDVLIGTKSGKSYRNGFDFSPMEYAQQMKTAGSSAKMKALAQALEDYGIAALNYYNRTGERVREAVRAVSAEEMRAWSASTEGRKPEGVGKMDISAVCEADNSLRIYFAFDAGHDPGSYSFQIDGRAATLQRRADGAGYLEVGSIAANELDTAHRFTISDGTNSLTIVCSVLTYAKMAAESKTEALADLGKALYLYNRAADAYFGT